jgi:excisionase family DNA binding protein
VKRKYPRRHLSLILHLKSERITCQAQPKKQKYYEVKNMKNHMNEKLDMIEDMLRKQQTILQSVPEAAELLKVSKHQIYKLCSQRQIPHFKVGGKILFDRTAIIDWALDPNNKVKTVDELQQEIKAESKNRSKK